MDHVSIKTNQHVKYETYVINSSQDNERKPCVHFLQVTLETLSPKSKGVMALSRTISMWNIIALLKYFSR